MLSRGLRGLGSWGGSHRHRALPKGRAPTRAALEKRLQGSRQSTEHMAGDRGCGFSGSKRTLWSVSG